MNQLFLALQYLHSQNISHRDIKPENFMLAKPDNLKCIKMIDFGLSKQLKDQDSSMHTMSGSPYYIAPEVFLQSYHLSSDLLELMLTSSDFQSFFRGMSTISQSVIMFLVYL